MKKLIIILLLITTASCGSSLYQHNQTEIEKARSFWVGETKQSLITSWGIPDSKNSDENGGEVYTYRRNNGYIVWVTNFYINAKDVIYYLSAHSE